MLGRPYVLDGRVERGEGRGTGLGVPTANLAVDADRCIPGPGVYAGWLRRRRRVASGCDRHRHAADLRRWNGHDRGARPRLRRRPLRRTVRLALTRRLRSERAFGSIAALKVAMAHDIDRTRAIVGGVAPPE